MFNKKSFLIIDFLIYNYSVLKDFIGLARAAFIAWEPTVNNAMTIAVKTATPNIHQ